MTAAATPPTTALVDVASARGFSTCLTPPLRPVFAPPAPICGTAVTVLLEPGAGGTGLGPLYELLSSQLSGRVLVIAGGGGVAGAVFGQILARAAVRGGLVAAVVDGAVRDVATFADEGLPLVALTEHTGGVGDLAHVAATRCQVWIGSTPVADGDLVVLDRGGAASLPAAHASALLEDAVALAQAEEHVLADLAAGLPLTTAYRHKRAATERLRSIAPAVPTP